MTIYFIIAGLIISILLSAWFSAAEMAYSSCNEIRLENEAEDGKKSAKRALKVLEKFDDSLSAILIGNNLVNIAASSLTTVLMIYLFKAKADSLNWAATVVLTVIIIIFGETVPKICAKRNANRYALADSFWLRALTVLLYPFIKLTVGLVWLFTLVIRKEKEETDEDESVEELQSIIETAEDEGVLDSDRTELVQAAIDFADISASEVMTARVDMEALDVDSTPEEVLAFIDETPFSRIPVYEDSIDHIIGTLHLNHYLKAITPDKAPDLRELLMPPCYVYKTTKLPDVLSALRAARQHLAIVTDEYSGTLGVISMEDVLEELVGDIWDESDEIEEEVVEKASGELEIDGDMAIGDFIELMEIPEDSFECESETVGGWVIEMLGGHFPEAGETFEYENLSVKVLEMDGLRVEKVLVKKL